MYEIQIIGIENTYNKIGLIKLLSSIFDTSIKEASLMLESLKNKERTLSLDVENGPEVDDLLSNIEKLGGITNLIDNNDIDIEEVDRKSEYLWTSDLDKYILVESDSDLGYSIMIDDNTHVGALLIENDNEAKYIIQKMLDAGVRIESEETFDKRFP